MIFVVVIAELIGESIDDRHHLGAKTVHSGIVDERIFQKLLLPNERVKEFHAGGGKVLLQLQLFVRPEEQAGGERPVLKLLHLHQTRGKTHIMDHITMQVPRASTDSQGSL